MPMTEEERANLKHGDEIECVQTGEIWVVNDYPDVKAKGNKRILIAFDEDAHGIRVSDLSLNEFKIRRK